MKQRTGAGTPEATPQTENGDVSSFNHAVLDMSQLLVNVQNSPV